MSGPRSSGTDELAVLERVQRKVLWLSTWMVHHANARPSADGTKVGGHQASSASVVSLLTALYFKTLESDDLVAVKAHAAPAFYACQYLRGRLPKEALTGLRRFGGLQAYPSRRKNPEIVELSTGSMGLGAVQATFHALGAQYLADHFGTTPPRRIIVMVGDAELDEGNVWEALAEETVARLGRVLWLVDVNRQALDRIIPEARTRQLGRMFAACGWRVSELRWGRRLRALFGAPGGERLRQRLDAMSNAEYQRLLRQPAGAVRKALVGAGDGGTDAELDRTLGALGDVELQAIVADVGGHDLALILEALEQAGQERDRPTVILAHTVKGWGLQLAADPLNHTALLTEAQVEELRASLGIAPGAEWDGFAPESEEAALVRGLPPLFSAPRAAAQPAVPFEVDETYPAECSTQEAFGRVLGALARLDAAKSIVTVSADVAVTTHLAGWINRKGVYFPAARSNPFADVAQPVQWRESPAGQHFELGIAEHNLFLLLGALGLTRELSGVTLLPIGTLYDPFVTRGLDALYHALYSGARFVVAATPSGVSLAPEGGAHQSVITPGIGVALPAMAYFEPAFAREVEWILLDALRGLADRTGESLYMRLTTKPVDQSLAPQPSDEYRARVLRGGYRLVDARGEPGWDAEISAVSIFVAGAMVPEAVEAARRLREAGVHASVFVVTSPDRLYRGLREPRPYLEELVGGDEEGVPIVSVQDGHSHGLAFLGGAFGVSQQALGVDDFGQSGTRADLYRHYAIDAAAITRAALLLLGR
ncbi:MAG TPA: 1-deoxy-D-xylulose-5-phosphate synthase N-terminal domain-containing protein [Methylomirabilota bacterium]|nr:1-deoxy-D-xylulose-5-phosphate synthase N-terminal domain-containing protein [Methylomirabilota bacterium]